jgi:hypothetical protein
MPICATFTGGMQNLLGRALNRFSNEAELSVLIGADTKTPSDRLKKLIDEELAKQPALAKITLPSSVLYQVAQMRLRECFSKIFKEHLPAMTAILNTMTAQAPAIVRKGHNEALSSSGLAPPARVEALAALAWSVWPAPYDGFILSDCVALGADDHTGFKPLIMADLNEVVTVLMPLSSTKMLVGASGSQATFDLNEYNKAAAARSHQFFIAATTGSDPVALTQLIGTFSDHFIENSVASAFEDVSKQVQAASPSDATQDGTPDAAVATIAPEPSQSLSPYYSIDFFGCADKETANRIAGTVYAVTGELCRVMPLDRLDGMTFAHDYPAALRDLNRGFRTSAPLQATNEDYGVGVAMAPLVIRNGVPKTHIVVRGDIGHLLISEKARCDRRYIQLFCNSPLLAVRKSWTRRYLAYC